MPDQPQNSPPSAASSVAVARPPRIGLSARLVPFVPILLALLIALIARRFQPPASPKIEKDLLGTKAPDFSLRDAHKEEGDDPVTLSLLVDKGPVVIIFFRGYSCPRCVGHLNTLAGDISDFTSAGIQIIAISPDTPANTRDSIQTYGDFPFPLLSDRDDKVARAFGLENPDGSYLHGAFVIDRERRIQFAIKDDHPYADTSNLLDQAKKLPPPH